MAVGSGHTEVMGDLDRALFRVLLGQSQGCSRSEPAGLLLHQLGLTLKSYRNESRSGGAVWLTALFVHWKEYTKWFTCKRK